MLPSAALGAIVGFVGPTIDLPAVERVYAQPSLGKSVSFRTPVDAVRRRETLRRHVFGTSTLPDGIPVIEHAVADTAFIVGLPNLASVDRLSISMRLGFTSVAYHAVPRRPNGALLIYHGGHRQGLSAGRRTIARFLARGYAILVFAMPFEGMNTHPETLDTRCGRVTIGDVGFAAYHDTLGCVPFGLRYFVEPVAVALNYVERFGYRVTAMTGLSGGGWTTMLYAALDPRVQLSYPVAGSRPHYVSARRCPKSWSVPRCYGDFEQRAPGLYRIANHLELYTLGAFGEGRKQLAFYNRYDRCCFAGTSYLEWEPRVQSALERLGAGSFDVVADATHRRHIISAFTHRVIENDLERALAAAGQR